MQNETSPFKDYLDTLPKDLSNFPIFFTDEELQWLTGSRILLYIESKKKEIAADYALVYTMPDVPKFSLRQF